VQRTGVAVVDVGEGHVGCPEEKRVSFRIEGRKREESEAYCRGRWCRYRCRCTEERQSSVGMLSKKEDNHGTARRERKSLNELIPEGRHLFDLAGEDVEGREVMRRHRSQN